jgi:hypothetical protein
MYVPYSSGVAGSPDLIINSALGIAALSNALRSLPPAERNLMLGSSCDRSAIWWTTPLSRGDSSCGRSVGWRVSRCSWQHSASTAWVTSMGSRRTHEFGVRLALGATPRDLHLQVLGSTARSTIGGVLLGPFGAIWATRLLVTELYSTSRFEPTVFTITVLLLLGLHWSPHISRRCEPHG